MPTTAWPAQGVTISIDEANPPTGTYTLIGQVLSIDKAGGGEVGERDTSNLSSTVKTSAPTIVDNGEVSVSLNFDPTDTAHAFILNLKQAPPGLSSTDQWYNFKVLFATGGTTTSVVMPCWVKSFDGANAEGVDDNLTADLTLRVTGAVTWVT